MKTRPLKPAAPLADQVFVLRFWLEGTDRFQRPIWRARLSDVNARFNYPVKNLTDAGRRMRAILAARAKRRKAQR
jgi:hypothetical protein